MYSFVPTGRASQSKKVLGGGRAEGLEAGEGEGEGGGGGGSAVYTV